MPKRVPEGAKRVPLNCLISPETKETLKKMGGSQGVAVDRAVVAWLKLQDVQQSSRFRFEGDVSTVPEARRIMKRKGEPQEVRHARKILMQTRRGPRQKGLFLPHRFNKIRSQIPINLFILTLVAGFMGLAVWFERHIDLCWKVTP